MAGKVESFLPLIRLKHEVGFEWGDEQRQASNNNNNQAFYFQASWGKLEMKPHELKNRDKTRLKKNGRENKGR
jgi:hypothetical protein